MSPVKGDFSKTKTKPRRKSSQNLPHDMQSAYRIWENLREKILAEKLCTDSVITGDLQIFNGLLFDLQAQVSWRLAILPHDRFYRFACCMLHLSSQSDDDLNLDLDLHPNVPSKKKIGIGNGNGNWNCEKRWREGSGGTSCACAEIFVSTAQLTHWLHASWNIGFGILNDHEDSHLSAGDCKKHEGEATVCHGQIQILPRTFPVRQHGNKA